MVDDDPFIDAQKVRPEDLTVEDIEERSRWEHDLFVANYATIKKSRWTRMRDLHKQSREKALSREQKFEMLLLKTQLAFFAFMEACEEQLPVHNRNTGEFHPAYERLLEVVCECSPPVEQPALPPSQHEYVCVECMRGELRKHRDKLPFRLTCIDEEDVSYIREYLEEKYGESDEPGA